MTTDKPTDAMIEAGIAAQRRELFGYYVPDVIVQRATVTAIYTAMHEARPQSTAPSPDADLVERLTQRFLMWRLPENFNPDNGISAKRPNYAANVEWQPTGTNLLDYEQAKAMVEYMLADEALTATAPPTDGDDLTKCALALFRALEKRGNRYAGVKVDGPLNWAITEPRTDEAMLAALETKHADELFYDGSQS